MVRKVLWEGSSVRFPFFEKGGIMNGDAEAARGEAEAVAEKKKLVAREIEKALAGLGKALENGGLPLAASGATKKKESDSESEARSRNHDPVFPDDFAEIREDTDMGTLSDAILVALDAKYARKYGHRVEAMGEDIVRVRLVTEANIGRQLRRYGKFQYARMERTKDFGLPGETRTRDSFCRAVLGIRPDRGVSPEDFARFDAAMAEFRSMSDAEIEAGARDFGLNILGKRFGPGDRDRCNALLASLGSDKRVYCSYQQGKRNLIFGKARIDRRGGHEFYCFESEEMRSPYAELSIIAGTSGNCVHIRRESAEMIFREKWVAALDAMPFASGNSSFARMEEALAAYGVRTRKDMERVRDRFVSEIMEGALWHEMGHTVVHEDVLSPEENALGRALYSRGVASARGFMELLADWAPERADGRTGPVPRLAKIAEEDPEKAERMIRVYLADYSFEADQDHPILCRQAEIVLEPIRPFVGRDRVDFERLGKSCDGVFAACLDTFRDMLKHLIEPVRTAEYRIDGAVVGFPEVDRRIRGILEGPVCRKELEKNREKLYPFFYWGNVLSWVERYSPETFAEIHRRSGAWRAVGV
jgi:hypothetical protein